MSLQKVIEIISQRKQKQDEPAKISINTGPFSNESLLAILIPEKVFTDKSYKDHLDRVVALSFYNFFDSCAIKIASSICQGYGVLHNMSKSFKPQGVAYEFTYGARKIEYSIHGLKDQRSRDGKTWSSAVYAKLKIEEPNLNLPLAKAFLADTLTHHLIRQAEATNKILIYLNQRIGYAEGHQVLDYLDLHPLDAARIRMLPGNSVYERSAI